MIVMIIIVIIIVVMILIIRNKKSNIIISMILTQSGLINSSFIVKFIFPVMICFVAFFLAILSSSGYA